MKLLPTPSRRLRRALALAAVITAAGASHAVAVAVSPAALYLDARSRSGTLTLTNQGSLPEEIEISFAFGYPVSDASGAITVPLSAAAPAGEPSAVEWLRAFPRRLILQPGQSQTVRILAQPPAGLEDGEYWGRVLVTSRGGQPRVEHSQGEVRMSVDVETVVVTAVSYRKGPMCSGVEVAAAGATPVDGGVQLTLDLRRQGNAAYLGRMHAELVAPGGRVVAEATDDLAVYHEIRRVLLFPLDAPVEEGYSVRYTLDTQRPDLPAGGAIEAPRRTGAVPVR